MQTSKTKPSACTLQAIHVVTAHAYYVGQIIITKHGSRYVYSYSPAIATYLACWEQAVLCPSYACPLIDPRRRHSCSPRRFCFLARSYLHLLWHPPTRKRCLKTPFVHTNTKILQDFGFRIFEHSNKARVFVNADAKNVQHFSFNILNNLKCLTRAYYYFVYSQSVQDRLDIVRYLLKINLLCRMKQSSMLNIEASNNIESNNLLNQPYMTTVQRHGQVTRVALSKTTSKMDAERAAKLLLVHSLRASQPKVQSKPPKV